MPKLVVFCADLSIDLSDAEGQVGSGRRSQDREGEGSVVERTGDDTVMSGSLGQTQAGTAGVEPRRPAARALGAALEAWAKTAHQAASPGAGEAESTDTGWPTVGEAAIMGPAKRGTLDDGIRHRRADGSSR